MKRMISSAGLLAGLVLTGVSPASAQLFDNHFHLLNYVQRPGDTTANFGNITQIYNWMRNTDAGRDAYIGSALFGIPLQQAWQPGLRTSDIEDSLMNNTLDRWNVLRNPTNPDSGMTTSNKNLIPDYYIKTDAELYYYSGVDALIAQSYLSLDEGKQAFFVPHITGFNPADMWAADHIDNMMRAFPRVFKGVGEFTIHKEFVSPKVMGTRASVLSKSLKRVLDLCADRGLVAVIHNDIDEVEVTLRPSAAPDVPAHRADMFKLLKEEFGTADATDPKRAFIIWAHTGLGRVVGPRADHLDEITEFLEETKNYKINGVHAINFDISWDVVAKWITYGTQNETKIRKFKQDGTPSADTAIGGEMPSLEQWATLFTAYPDRFVWGSDTLAAKSKASIDGNAKAYHALWDKIRELSPNSGAAIVNKIKRFNLAKIYRAAAERRIAWENRVFGEMREAGLVQVGENSGAVTMGGLTYPVRNNMTNFPVN